MQYQLIQPFRADSISLLVSSANTFGWPPPWTYGVLPLFGGGLTAIALALRAPRTPAAFAAAIGLTLLVTVLLSKQAFMNYYFLVSGAFLIAAVAWPTQPGPATRTVRDRKLDDYPWDGLMVATTTCPPTMVTDPSTVQALAFS